jgi:alpha-L-fucosidase 2
MHGLRARGGFQVDVDWKDGKLASAKITSLAGTKGRVRYRGKTVELRMKMGESVRMVEGAGGELAVAVVGRR